MSRSVEERLAALEKKVAQLQDAERGTQETTSKEALIEMFGRAKDDPHFESAARLGAQWREEENRRSLGELDAGT